MTEPVVNKEKGTGEGRAEEEMHNERKERKLQRSS